MPRNDTIIWVHLHDGRDAFFGSIAAIYEVFTRDEVGITKESLWQACLPYSNKRCTVKRMVLHRKPHRCV